MENKSGGLEAVQCATYIKGGAGEGTRMQQVCVCAFVSQNMYSRL